MKQRLLVGGAALIALMGGTATWLLLSGGSGWKETDFPPTYTSATREHALRLEGRWSALQFVRAGDEAAIRSTLAAAAIDPDGVLEESAREALIDALIDHIETRAESTPDAYLSLAADDPTMIPLSDTDSRDFVETRNIYEYEFGEPPPRDANSRGVLRRLWRRCMDEKGHRFAAVVADPTAAAMLVRRIRVPTQILDSGLEIMPPEKQSLLYGAPLAGGATKFHQPAINLASFLAERPGVVAANVHLLVRLENSLMFNWMSDWWLDDEAGRWVCHRMGRKSTRVVRLFF